MNYWFTADFHLGHKNIIKYCNRPFSSVEEMDKTILGNLFGVLQERDRLFFLGDLSFKSTIVLDFLEKLRDKGIRTQFIFGNHDEKNTIEDWCDLNSRWCKCGDLYYTTIETWPIVMSHYAMRVWHKSHFNSWQIYAHSHNTLPPVGKQLDVGVDCNNFMPFNLKQVIEHMNKQPDNFNYIKDV